MIDLLAISPASLTAVNRSIYRALAERGWSVEIVVPTAVVMPGGERRHDPPRPGDPPLVPLPPTPGNPRLSSFHGLWALLDAKRPKVVLLDNDPNSGIAVQLGLWARWRGAALVCQSCENLTRRWLPAARRGGARGLAGAALTSALCVAARPRVDHVFVISDDGLRVLAEQGYPSVSKIPLGFDPALFRPDPELRAATRQRLGLGSPTVAYFGRLSREKGVHLLIEALGGLRDTPFQLLLDEFKTYRTPYEEQIARLLVEHGLESRVVRFDARHDEMPAYMNAADVVVLPSIATPSWKEQYGRVAPEAMACGATVVASRSGALPELVGSAGVLVPEGDVGALRQTLAELLADPARRSALGAAAAERAHAHLDLRRQVELMLAVLEPLRRG